jgi:hypothetical protein
VGACHGSSVAKCFNSFTVATTAACALRVAPVDPGGATSVLVPSLFAAGDTYAELVACPAAGQDSLATSFTDDSLLADLRALLASAIWPTPLTTLGALSAAGGVLSTNDSSTGSVCALDWQVVSATVSGTASPSPAAAMSPAGLPLASAAVGRLSLLLYTLRHAAAPRAAGAFCLEGARGRVHGWPRLQQLGRRLRRGAVRRRHHGGGGGVRLPPVPRW